MSAREKKRPTGAVVGVGVAFDLLLGLVVIPTEAQRFFCRADEGSLFDFRGLADFRPEWRWPSHHELKV
jgi:hypothetical protein